MKNPKTMYVSSAGRLKKSRQVRKILLLSLAVVFFLALIMILYVLQSQREIDESFPSGMSTPMTVASTLPSIETVFPGTDNPSSFTSESSAASDTDSSGTNESSGASTVNLKLPVYPPPENDVLIKYSGLLQTVTHKERDIALAKLKQSVKQYIEGSVGNRIGFYYTNLKNSEEFGYNDLSPFVVGGAVNLPINLILYEEARTGILSFLEVLEYEKDDFTEGTGQIIHREVGVQYYIRSLSQLSLASSDNIATAMILRRLGGIDKVSERFGAISSIVDYSSVYYYADFSKKQQSGKQRSGAQDLARYARELYFLYLSYPDHYQPMMNDLAVTSSASPFAGVFAEGTQIFRKSGLNTRFSSSAEVAIIICEEPIVLCITVESASNEQLDRIKADLGQLVADYILYCYY